ncbi:MAG: hypothetical protein ACE5G2_01680 [Candidatus Krumholzibacteriia bacterium]
MPFDAELPPASLASLDPYPVPDGARLQFRYTCSTTDGFMRGDVVVVFENGGPKQVIARNIPVMGTSRTARAVGDYAKIFPDPIPVARAENAAE